MNSKRDFEVFKKEFMHWQDVFNLDDWRVYFEHIPLHGSYARIGLNHVTRVATAALATERNGCDKDIKGDAKHEAIHLLLADLSGIANERCIMPDAVNIECEKLVEKLIKIIK